MKVILFLFFIISAFGCETFNSPKNAMGCSQMCGGFGQIPKYDAMSGTCYCEPGKN